MKDNDSNLIYEAYITEDADGPPPAKDPGQEQPPAIVHKDGGWGIEIPGEGEGRVNVGDYDLFFDDRLKKDLDTLPGRMPQARWNKIAPLGRDNWEPVRHVFKQFLLDMQIDPNAAAKENERLLYSLLIHYMKEWVTPLPIQIQRGQAVPPWPKAEWKYEIKKGDLDKLIDVPVKGKKVPVKMKVRDVIRALGGGNNKV